MVIDFLEYKTIWMIVGLLILFLEMFLASGVGLLFIGLGVITTYLILQFDIIDINQRDLHIAIFLLSSILWALILYFPLCYIKKSQSNYHDIVGSLIILDKDIEKGVISSILWSGVQMRAALDDKEKSLVLRKGVRVKVQRVTGNVLYLKKETNE